MKNDYLLFSIDKKTKHDISVGMAVDVNNERSVSWQDRNNSYYFTLFGRSVSSMQDIKDAFSQAKEDLAEILEIIRAKESQARQEGLSGSLIRQVSVELLDSYNDIPDIVNPLDSLYRQAVSEVAREANLSGLFEEIVALKADIDNSRRESGRLYAYASGLLSMKSKSVQFSERKRDIQEQVNILRGIGISISQDDVGIAEARALRETATIARNKVGEIFTPVAPLYRDAQIAARTHSDYAELLTGITVDRDAILRLKSQSDSFYNGILIIEAVGENRSRMKEIDREIELIKTNLDTSAVSPLRTHKEDLEQRCVSNVPMSLDAISSVRRETATILAAVPNVIPPSRALYREAEDIQNRYPILENLFQSITESRDTISQSSTEIAALYSNISGLLRLSEIYNQFEQEGAEVDNSTELLENIRQDMKDTGLTPEEVELKRGNAEQLRDQSVRQVQPLGVLYTEAVEVSIRNGLGMCLASVTRSKEVLDNKTANVESLYSEIVALAILTGIYRTFSQAKVDIPSQLAILKIKEVEIEADEITREEVMQVKIDSLAAKNTIDSILAPVGALYDTAQATGINFPSLNDYVQLITEKKTALDEYGIESGNLYNRIDATLAVPAEETVNEIRIGAIRDVFLSTRATILDGINRVLKTNRIQAEQDCASGQGRTSQEIDAVRVAITNTKSTIDELTAPTPALLQEAQEIAVQYPALNGYLASIEASNDLIAADNIEAESQFDITVGVLRMLEIHNTLVEKLEEISTQVSVLNDKQSDIQAPGLSKQDIILIQEESLNAKNRIDEISQSIPDLYSEAQTLSGLHNLNDCLTVITGQKDSINSSIADGVRFYNMVEAVDPVVETSGRIKAIRAQLDSRRRLVLVQLQMLREKNAETKVQNVTPTALARIKMESTSINDAIGALLTNPTNSELLSEAQDIAANDASLNDYLLDVVEYKGTVDDYKTESDELYKDIVAYIRIQEISRLFDTATLEVYGEIRQLRNLANEIQQPDITPDRIQEIKNEATTIFNEAANINSSLEGLFTEASRLAGGIPGGAGYIVGIRTSSRSITGYISESRTLYATINGPIRIKQIRAAFLSARVDILEQVNILNEKQLEAEVPGITPIKKMEIRTGSTEAKNRAEGIVASLAGLHDEATRIVRGNQSFSVYLQDISEYDTNITDYLEEVVSVFDVIIALISANPESRSDLEERMGEISLLFSNVADLISREEASILDTYRQLELNTDSTQQENATVAVSVLNSVSIIIQKTDEMNALYSQGEALADLHPFLQDPFLIIKKKRSDGVTGILDHISAALYNKNKIFEILERREYFHFANQTAEELKSEATERIKTIRLLHDNARHEALRELEVVRAQDLMAQTPIPSQSNKQTLILATRAKDSIVSLKASLVAPEAQAEEIVSDYEDLRTYLQDILEYRDNVADYELEADLLFFTIEVAIGQIVPDVVDISTVDQLKGIGTNSEYKYGDVIDGYFRLVSDIDLAGSDFTSIGSSIEQFIGNFDGGSHTISNLPQPLFAYISTGANVSDVILGGRCTGALVDNMEGGKVSGVNRGTVSDFNNSDYVGGLVSKMRGGTAGGHNDLNVNGSCAGGIVGVMFGGDVRGSSGSAGRVNGSEIAGGLVGLMDSRALVGDKGKVSGSNQGTVSSGDVLGGVVGKLISSGEVIADNSGDMIISGNAGVTMGGIIGLMEAGSLTGNNLSRVSGDTVENLQNTVGGAVGRLRGGFVKVHISDAVIGTSQSTVGGAVGIMEYGSVEAYTSTEDAYGEGISGGVVGGLVGVMSGGALRGWNTVDVDLDSSTATARNPVAGGLVGRSSGDVDIIGYNEGDIASSHDSARIGGLIGRMDPGQSRVIGYSTRSVRGAFRSAGLAELVNCDQMRGYNTGYVQGSRIRALVGNIASGTVKGYARTYGEKLVGSVRGDTSNADDVAELPELGLGVQSYAFLTTNDFLFVEEGADVMGWLYHTDRHPTINYVGYLDGK